MPDPGPTRCCVPGIVWIALALSGAPEASTHPAHAEELNHPFVPGFERFFSEEDPPERLARGGELLLNELNCVACHAPSGPLRERFPGAPGPGLADVASRFGNEVVLRLLARNPRVLKRSTRMPSLFAAGDRDETELEALHAYLATLRTPPAEPLLLGDVERGRALYHTVGCVACHAPDPEYFPPRLDRTIRLEAPALPSQPIRIALHWSTEFLTRYLLDPEAAHPGGRMPSQGLEELEAADIAAYLHSSPFREDPDPALGPGAADPALAASGKLAFTRKGCANCHGDDSTPPGPGRQATPLLDLRPVDAGCLAPSPTEGAVPYYYLSPLQRAALRLAIEGLALADSEPSMDEWLTRRNCFACHEREGTGGPEPAREPYFGAISPYPVERAPFLPPSLDEALGRWEDASLAELLRGDRPRPDSVSPTRMVRLRDDAVQEFLRCRARENPPPAAE
jgi:mono/diheme cytochrome c family protein